MGQIEELIEVMAPIVTAACIGSFEETGGTVTNSELRRRVNICHDLIKVMYFELEWSRIRIRDVLPQVLKHKLIGLEIPLDTYLRNTWAGPNGG